VALDTYHDPNLISQAVATVVGLREEPGRPLTETLLDHLKPMSALLVLDNCEHLLTTCAQLADALLRACPSLTILATSREPLGVPGEITWRVPSMSLPAEPEREPIEMLRLSDAVSLFIDRAAQVRPHFTITAANAPAVAQICHDLDGIPLALDLAAARVRSLPLTEIVTRLGDSIDRLTEENRTHSDQIIVKDQTIAERDGQIAELTKSNEDNAKLIDKLNAQVEMQKNMLTELGPLVQMLATSKNLKASVARSAKPAV